MQPVITCLRRRDVRCREAVIQLGLIDVAVNQFSLTEEIRRPRVMPDFDRDRPTSERVGNTGEPITIACVVAKRPRELE